MVKKNSTRQTDAIRQFILKQIAGHPRDITIFAANRFGVSRQAVLRHMRKMEVEGLVIIEGATRDRVYRAARLSDQEFVYSIKPGLGEDKIWREDLRPFLQGLNKNVLDICQYGVTEMVNNAIEHSGGTQLNVHLRHTQDSIEFGVVDDGMGLFKKIQNELGLDDPLHVMLELSKGKLTTDPARHTGEGIFFTTRAFDEVALQSGGLRFLHTEETGDWLIEDGKVVAGTDVRLRISPQSDRILREVFNRFTTGDDYGFTKTRVPVSLAKYGDENLVSRSQARRLLARFERFREVILDFEGVEEIGQAFADEIFRVFRNQHPEILLVVVNANERVSRMIGRAEQET